MLSALEKYFPDHFKWSQPQGGMFLWVEGPQGFDMEKVYWKSVHKKVAFVPGKYFYAQPGEGVETMRLNYTMADEETIDFAVKTLSELIQDEFDEDQGIMHVKSASRVGYSDLGVNRRRVEKIRQL